MPFPKVRLRRLRTNSLIRDVVEETDLPARRLMIPYFVRPGKDVCLPIASMPGQNQISVDVLVREVQTMARQGIKSVLLFGIPRKKDPSGSEAYAPNGIIQTAIKAVKKACPDMLVAADLCFCEYTSHGHCGVLKKGDVDNDATLKLIAKTALVQARAGADIIAPSGMMDGMVKAIRTALDKNGFQDRIIMSYAAKYASAFYGPFREAAESAPKFGDRRSYQMNAANAEEALREVAQDIEEGADIVMVKPALAYMDIIRRVKEKFHVPVAAYNVSGEYAMVKAAGQKGWIDERRVTSEILLGLRRAGADLIITYHAKELLLPRV